MWVYEKRLQYPVNIKNPDPQMAQVIITQMGGPDGELAASMRYISQRYAMPNCEVAGLLTDIGVSVMVLRIYRKCHFVKTLFRHTEPNHGNTDGKSVSTDIYFNRREQ